MQNILIQRRVPALVFLQSLLVAFFMDVKCMNEILRTYGLSESDSLMTILYMLIVGAIFIIGFFQKHKSSFSMGTIPKAIFFYIALSYGITIATGGIPYVNPSHLLVFTVCAFLIPFIAEIDPQLTLKGVMLFPILGINRLSMIFVFVTDWNEWISMGLSYAFYTPIVASIIYIFSYWKDESKMNMIVTMVLFAVNMVYLFMIFQFGSRGPIVLLLLLIVFLFSVKKNENDVGVKINKVMLGGFGIAGLIVINAFDEILKFILGLLTDFGITSRTVSKFLVLSAEGDVDHGRNEILAKSWDGFFDSPIWGHGIDCFNQNTGIVYPHNFLMQILYDGGLILFCLLLIPAFKRTISLYKQCDRPIYGILSFYLFAGIGRGLFSGDLWRLALLWMFFSFVFSNKFIYRTHE